MDKPGPSRKAIIGWGVGMLTTVGLCWFAAAVVVPVWRCRSIVAEYDLVRVWVEAGWFVEQSEGGRPVSRTSKSESRSEAYFGAAREPVENLGGPEKAAQTLGLYLRLPERVAPCKLTAIWLLGACGSPATSVLESARLHRNEHVRQAAAEALRKIRGESEK